MAVKTLIVQTKIDRAVRGHNCQANARHRIKKGDVRLGVRNGLGWDHYCCACAETIIARDIQKLTNLQGLKLPVIEMSETS